MSGVNITMEIITFFCDHSILWIKLTSPYFNSFVTSVVSFTQTFKKLLFLSISLF